MENNKDIGKLFRDKIDQLDQSPNENGWFAIQSELDKKDLIIEQFQLMLLDFQRWQVLRGNRKAIRMRFGKLILENILTPNPSFNQDQKFQEMKLELENLGKVFRKSIKDKDGKFNFYELLENGVDNVILQKQWNELSVLVLKLFNKPGMEEIVQKFAIDFNPNNGKDLSEFKLV